MQEFGKRFEVWIDPDCEQDDESSLITEPSPSLRRDLAVSEQCLRGGNSPAELDRSVPLKHIHGSLHELALN